MRDLDIFRNIIDNLDDTFVILYDNGDEEVATSPFVAAQAFFEINQPLDGPNNKFPTLQDAYNYYDPILGQIVVDNTNAEFSTNIFQIGNFITIPRLVGIEIDKKFNKPTGTTAQYIRGDGSLATLPSSASKSYTNPTRTLNTAFQISSTREATVSYSVDTSCTMSLVSGQSGTVVLEYADDSGITTNVKTVARATNANTGSLTIGLNLTQTGSNNLSGSIPAGKYVRIRTVNNTGTPSFTIQNAQEVLI